MRFSQLAMVTFVLASTSLAAPLKRGFLDGVKTAATEVGDLIHSNATLSGIASTVKQSIENPQLTAARLTVVKSLIATQSTLSQIDNQANTTGNSGVSSLVATGQPGLSSARAAVDRIGEALVSGTTPSKDDQKLVAEGIKVVRDAVNQMSGAITTPDSTLSGGIATAQNNVKTLQTAGTAVLAAANLTFADLGLPDNFATS